MFLFPKNSSLLLTLFLLLLSPLAQAQLVKPPVWNIRLEGKELEVGKTATLVMEAQIPMGWYVYSNDFDKNLGPLLTEFIPANSADFSVAGKLQGIQAKKKYDEVWEGDITYFMGKGRFEQPITLLSTTGVVTGSLEYQMCSDLTGQCINYEQDIEVRFTAKAATVIAQETTPAQKADTSTSAPPALAANSPVENADSTQGARTPEQETIPLTDAEDSESLVGFMVLAFLAGLAALITP